MEWNFSPWRLAIFLGAMVGFWLVGGFQYPEPSTNSDYRPDQLSRAWLASVGLFFVGAGCVSVIDHWSGDVDRANIRSAYVVIGSLIMGSSLLWLNALKASN